MKKWVRVLLIVLLSVFTFSSLIILFFATSPYPTAWLVRWAFGSSSYTDHINLDETKENVEILSDISYPSVYKNNTIDIIYPSNSDLENPLPVIYWVHGGAFVAGDKDDVTNYMIMLANEGFVIVNINYELAPKAKYPAPLIQIGEAYLYIENSDDLYPFIDKDTIYFGGDSAGAHIAAQFINIQTNNDYVELLNTLDMTKDIKKVVNKNITGAILFAGPYDFNALSNLVKSRAEKSNNKVLTSLISFVAKRIGQGYLGTLNWKGNKDFEVLSLINYVSENFPKTFLTDGRKISFEGHSKALENALKNKEVSVTSLYHDFDLFHEYQFNLGTISEDLVNYAQITFDNLILFLNE